MKIKMYQTERFQDYRFPVMYIAFPKCTFKCEKECKQKMCQNSHIVKMPDIDVSEKLLCREYIKNPITQAVVLGGLEPFDSWEDVKRLLLTFKAQCITDPIIIYTGYTEEELNKNGILLYIKSHFRNIIIKLGRFIPNRPTRFDDILGVTLASDNQYAKRIC